MFTWTVCELLQNLLRMCPLNSATKTKGPDGCWVCSCSCLNKGQISGCFVLDFSVLNALQRLRLEGERPSSQTRMVVKEPMENLPALETNTADGWKWVFPQHLSHECCREFMPVLLPHSGCWGLNFPSVFKLFSWAACKAILNFRCFRAKWRLAQE